MCEPLSVGIHACHRAGIGAPTSVLIIGGGPIGLVSMLIARAFGAPHIVVADVDAERLRIAKELGADSTVLVSTNEADVDQDVLYLRGAMGACEIDVTLDCVGFTKTISTALKATRTGGVTCLVGMGHSEMKVPLTPAAAREVDLRGVFRYRSTYPLCINLLKTGKINVQPLITHRFGFSRRWRMLLPQVLPEARPLKLCSTFSVRMWKLFCLSQPGSCEILAGAIWSMSRLPFVQFRCKGKCIMYTLRTSRWIDKTKFFIVKPKTFSSFFYHIIHNVPAAVEIVISTHLLRSAIE